MMRNEALQWRGQMSPGRLTVSVVGVVDTLLGGYIELFARVVRQLGHHLGVPVPRLPWEPEPPTIDQRLARLEEAKAALAESLAAIEDLQRQAEESKRDHARARSELAATIASKDDAERKLEAIKRLMDQDIEAFQTVAGVANIRKERMIGFGSGIAASVIASLLWALATFALKRLGILPA
jgi:flagellar hook-basal body complex protein FliE